MYKEEIIKVVKDEIDLYETVRTRFVEGSYWRTQADYRIAALSEVLKILDNYKAIEGE